MARERAYSRRHGPSPRTIRESVLPDVHAFTARSRPAARARHRAGRRRSVVRDLRAEQGPGGERVRLCVDLQRLPATATLDDLLALVRALNASDAHDGILVQSPLPAAMGRGAAQRVFDAIDPDEGRRRLHPVNVGRLVQGRAARWCRARRPASSRCSCAAGSRSPAPAPSSSAAATSSASRWRCCCCSATPPSPSATRKTPDLAAVAAHGRHPRRRDRAAGFVTPDFVKPGATVIDVGINRGHRCRRGRAASSRPARRGARTSSGAARSSSATSIRASRRWPGALTPVPGGVGPLTIAMLLKNTVRRRRARTAHQRLTACCAWR